MSKSDAQRRSYLADQMTMGERVEALDRSRELLEYRVGALEEKLDHFENDDSQYFHDELRSLGRRVGEIEKRTQGESIGFNLKLGTISVEFERWQHLCRLESEHAECKANMTKLYQRACELDSENRDLKKATNPGMTHFVGDDCAGGHRASSTECGRVVVNANEWDRLNRLEKAVLEFKQREPGEVTFRNAASWNAWVAVTKELK